jgi:hypothetical protein
LSLPQGTLHTETSKACKGTYHSISETMHNSFNHAQRENREFSPFKLVLEFFSHYENLTRLTLGMWSFSQQCVTTNTAHQVTNYTKLYDPKIWTTPHTVAKIQTHRSKKIHQRCKSSNVEKNWVHDMGPTCQVCWLCRSTIYVTATGGKDVNRSTLIRFTKCVFFGSFARVIFPYMFVLNWNKSARSCLLSQDERREKIATKERKQRIMNWTCYSWCQSLGKRVTMAV